MYSKFSRESPNAMGQKQPPHLSRDIVLRHLRFVENRYRNAHAWAKNSTPLKADDCFFFLKKKKWNIIEISEHIIFATG